MEGEELAGLLPGPAEGVLVALDDWATSVSAEKAEPVVQSGSHVVAIGGDGRLDPSFAWVGVYSSPDSIGGVEPCPTEACSWSATTGARR